MISLLEDLRFAIGLFFAIISFLLLLAGLNTSTSELGYNLNLIVGSLVGGFSILMMTLGILGQRNPQGEIVHTEGQSP